MEPRRSAMHLVTVLAALSIRNAQGEANPRKVAEVELNNSEPLTTLDENNFGDRGDTNLAERSTYSYTLGNGYKCALSGWTHSRDYAKGFVRSKAGSAFAKVSGLIPGALYAWKVYQFASNFKYDEPANNLVVNNAGQGLTPQSESKTATKSGISTADSSGQMSFEFVRNSKQVHLSALALAKTGQPCSKWSTTGWHKGSYKRTFSASQAPDGEDWTWQQCASRCADELDCDFWTLQQGSGGRCFIMVGTAGDYKDVGGHAEGAKESSCSAFSSLKSRISGLQSQIVDFNNHLTLSEQQVSDIKEVVKKDQQQIKKETTDKHDLVVQVRLLMSQKAKLLQSLENMTAQKDETMKRLEQTQADLSSKSSQLEQTQADLSSKSSQLEQTQADLSSKSKELESKTHEYEQVSSKSQELASQLDQYKRSTSDLSSKLHVKEKTLDSMSKELQDVTIKRDFLEAEKDRLENKVRTSKEVTQHLADELTETRAKRNELLKEYSDPSVQHFLEAKAWKVYEHPGVYHTVNKSFKYVLPTLKMRYEQGQSFFNSSQRRIRDRLNAFVGNKRTEPYLPMVSGILVYGIAIVPFFCALSLLTRALCQRREILVFFHVWFALTCLSASAFAIFTGAEPLAVFAMHDAALYLFSQVVFGLMLLLYALFLLMSWCLCSAGGTHEPCFRMIQATILIPSLLVYFLFIWTPAIQDRLPEMDQMMLMAFRALGLAGRVSGMWIPYLLGAFVFAAEGVLELLCFRAAQKRSRLEYIESKIKVRDLEELSALVPGKRLDDEKTS
eukprot:TRINITY_DN7520_c0_g1_i1.p1 TRINITY_DN7520_c0_g1~~TRINITY_DN7520_c0_g1_i1.p1  ORF type:complete len:794 (-),score=126.83 TRINITY_DN7520_c0_g1_i1:269-2626(-)